MHGGRMFAEEILATRQGNRAKVKASAESAVTRYGNETADSTLYRVAKDLLSSRMEMLSETMADWKELPAMHPVKSP